jgi:quinolinate synthase
MFQTPLPVEYMQMGAAETAARIERSRSALGPRLVILGHHYQRDEIIRWADLRGDSLKLSQLAARATEAEYFVFCGVHFMAESADILTRDDQVVILPNMAAGCSLADMARLNDVEKAWAAIQGSPGASAVTPITYVNSAADLKAFVGRNHGACCTSSNAAKVLEWALSRSERVFFFPDQHLGRNTAAAMGLDPDRDMVVWDPAAPPGPDALERVGQARVILWKGHCSVHQRFTTEQIAQARRDHPGVQVVVHPECELAVVRAADYYGSTEYILDRVRGAQPGSIWAVGTEINLVRRMQTDMPDRTVFCLDPIVCPCSTMYRIHPRYVAWALDNLAAGVVVNRVSVDAAIRDDARLALDRMLAIC